MWAHSAALLTEAAGDLTPQLGVRSVATSSGNSTTIVANKPPHLADGDVWEVWIGLPDQNGVVIDTPAGWTAQGTVDSLTPGGQFLACFTKEITDAAGESSTQSFTKSTGGTAGDDQYETTSVAVGDVGAGTGTVEPYDFAGLEDTAGSTQTTSSLTTGADGDVVLSAFVQDQSTSDGAWAPSSPSTLRELSEEWTTSGNMGLAVYAETRGTAGSGTHSATQTTGGDNTRGSATGIIAFRFVSGGLQTITLTATAAVGVASIIRAPGRVLASSGVSSPSVVRAASRTLTVTAANAASVIRAASRTLAATATGTATIALIRILNRTLTATPASAAVTVSRAPARVLAASGASVVAVARSAARALSATGAGSVTVIRAASRTLAAAAVSSASIVAVKVKVATLAATATGTATVTRAVSRALAATGAASATVARAGSRVLAAAATASTTVRRDAQRTLTAAATAATVVARAVSRSLAAATSSAATVQRAAARTLTTTGTITTTLTSIVSGAEVLVLGFFRAMRPGGRAGTSIDAAPFDPASPDDRIGGQPGGDFFDPPTPGGLS